jgi:carboxymethylenebutenolidase
MTDYITIGVPEGSFRAYVARPESDIAPAVVVLQEVFGVNSDMRAACDELAAAGFIAIAPDLFWRDAPGLDLSYWTDSEWKKGLSLYETYDLDKGVHDVTATIATARSLEGSSGRVGLMGFCLGGLMTFLTTAREDVDAAVSYYGGATEKHLSEAKAIKSPMLMHLGEEDEFISKKAQAQISAAVADNKLVTVYSYPGCSHAFARHTGTRFDPNAAALANERTRTFFRRILSE